MAWIKFVTIKNCARVLLLERDLQEFLRKMRNPKLEPLRKTEVLKAVVKKCNVMAGSKKAVKCSRCNHTNGMVKKGPSEFPARLCHCYGYVDECKSAISHSKDFKGNVKFSPSLDPELVYHLLRNMTDEDCELYLNDRPENFILTHIPVPPIAIRSSVFVDGGTQQ